MVVIGHQVLYPRFRVVAARWGNGQTILDTPRVSQRFYEDCPGILLREKCRLIKMNRGWVGNGGVLPPSTVEEQGAYGFDVEERFSRRPRKNLVV